MEYPKRLTDAFEEHGMIVVKIPVIQLATAKHEVELRELINERAAPELIELTRICSFFLMFNQHGSSSFFTLLKHCFFVIA